MPSVQALKAEKTKNGKRILSAVEQGAEVVDVAVDEAGADASEAIAATKVVQQAWPAALPEQVRAMADVLAASPVPLGLAAHFKGRGPWKKSLPALLQTLEALGRVHGSGTGDARQWQSWQM